MVRRTMTYLTVLTVILFCGAASAAEKERKRPYPHYWISIDTTNQGMPGMSEEMAGLAAMFGGKGPAFGPRRDLRLQLESPRSLPARPEADHGIPPAQNMGTSLPLVTPVAEKAAREVPERYERPERMEKPKGRMLFYWGCGEAVGKGQPRVFDAERMKPEEMAGLFKSRTPSVQTPPSVRKGWVYGEWPSREERKDIPRESTLVGEHIVKGNYIPDIRFSLDKRRDFMAPVEFSSIQATPAGATKVEWKAVPTAIGYFATAMGQNDKGDTVFWSSSEVQEMGSALMDYLTPGDVNRFIMERVVMEPARTACAIPPIFNNAQGGMLQFIAYGEQLDIVHPPRPKDPKQPWEPQWSLKVRLKSTGMSPLMAGAVEGTDRKTGPSAKGRKPSAPRDEATAEQEQPADDKPDAGGRKEGVGGILRGMFGF